MEIEAAVPYFLETMMDRISDLEDGVLNMLLSGSDETLLILRDQLQEALRQNRTMTGAGFFTKFLVPPTARHLPGKPSFSFGDVVADVDGLKNGAGFVLHVRDGCLVMLEGYSYGEPWPERVSTFTLEYSNGAVRDVAALRAKFQGGQKGPRPE